eukprot:m.55067 g.55067  ORF g.55067 m.55067 type:complete len:428 (-) comp13649_c0_seq31:2110-3393(-)
MGKTQSRGGTLERSQPQRELSPAEYHSGLENFGNTCYCNSVLQALYSCVPFRQAVLTYRFKDPAKQQNMLHALADLYYKMGTKKRRGAIPPRHFHQMLRADNEAYNNSMQQDAQEFLNYLLNRLAELVLEKNGSDPSSANSSANSTESTQTWVHEIFQGTLTNELKCMTCESVKTQNESFLDLSVDVTQNCSLTSCLRNYSSTETLCDDSKYQCETCCSKQEGQKRLRISKLPNIFAVQLKRFKYSPTLNSMQKLSWRVVHPVELRLVNVMEGAEDAERVYDLFAIVIHIGQHLSRGHYISMVKSGDHWLLYDDDRVDQMTEDDLEIFFGHTQLQSRNNRNSETAYLLFYQARDCQVDIPAPSPQRSVPASNTSTLSRNVNGDQTDAVGETKDKPTKARGRWGRRKPANRDDRDVLQETRTVTPTTS